MNQQQLNLASCKTWLIWTDMLACYQQNLTSITVKLTMSTKDEVVRNIAGFYGCFGFLLWSHQNKTLLIPLQSTEQNCSSSGSMLLVWIHWSNLHVFLTFVFVDFCTSSRSLWWHLSTIVNGRHGKCSSNTGTSTFIRTVSLSMFWTEIIQLRWLKFHRESIMSVGRVTITTSQPQLLHVTRASQNAGIHNFIHSLRCQY